MTVIIVDQVQGLLQRRDGSYTDMWGHLRSEAGIVSSPAGQLL